MDIYDNRTYAVAYWEDEYGCTYEWPQGMKDNRRSRVLNRIRRYGMAIDESTLVIHHIPKDVIVTTMWNDASVSNTWGTIYLTERM